MVPDIEAPTRKQGTCSTNPLSVSNTEAIRNVEPGSELDRVIQRWKGFKLIVNQDEKWLLEGFVNFFQNAYEIARTVDPSLPPQLPPQCFDVEEITMLFRLPADAFASYRQQHRGVRVRACGPPRPPGRLQSTRWIAEFIHERDRKKIPRKKTYKEFRELFPDQNGDSDRLRRIYRRYFGRRPDEEKT